MGWHVQWKQNFLLCFLQHLAIFRGKMKTMMNIKIKEYIGCEKCSLGEKVVQGKGKLHRRPGRGGGSLAMITSPRPQLLSPAKLTRFSMENLPQKDYLHYNHTDSCKDARWTARESYQFMYERPWQQVLHFYSNAVNGRLSLFSLFRSETCHDFDSSSIQVPLAKIEHERPSIEDRTGRWARVTFKIILSYCGTSFDGWQKQPDLNTVQGLVEGCLGKFVDEKKAHLLKEKCLPVEGCAVVAGRTDKGVTALQQVCSFYTWRKDVTPRNIEDAINCAAPGRLRVISVSEVSRAFHPNFSAKWRRYLYIFPLIDEEHRTENATTGEETEKHRYNGNCDDPKNVGESNYVKVKNLSVNHYEEETGDKDKPRTFTVYKVNELLQKLEGRSLPYKIFARDTKASRNVGPATECFIYHARAVEARLPSMDQDEERRVMCVELVANRFLRKMVRVLVATTIREAAAGATEDALLKLMDATCRRATAPPAPPDGLCLVDVGYSEFDPKICFISRD